MKPASRRWSGSAPTPEAPAAPGLPPGSPIRVRKLRPDRSEAFAWEGTVLGSNPNGIVLRAAFNVPVVELGFTTFRRGDVFVEFYYFERWYNVFQVRAPDGELKGYYANVGLPAELDAAAGELRYVDLALDVWVAPDGSFLVLDEDEFEELLRTWPALADGARRGRAELLALVEAGQLPSWSAEC